MIKVLYIAIIVAAFLQTDIVYAQAAKNPVTDYEVGGSAKLSQFYKSYDSPSLMKAVGKYKIDTASKSSKSKLNSRLHPHIKKGKWVPTGALEDPVSIQCHPKTIEKKLINFKGSEFQKISMLRNYFKNCKKEIKRNKGVNYEALINYGKLHYRINQVKGIKNIGLKFQSGESVTGILVMQDQRKRPFVIFKCGLFCETTEGSNSVLEFVMHLTDEAPFNMLILSNHTSVRNIKENGRVQLGGYYEGQELLAVGEWLKYESPYSHLVQSVHGLGVSLGGNAALFAALYNDHNPSYDGEKVFNSFIAFCPVVDTKATIKKVFKTSLRGLIFNWLTWDNIKSAYGQVPDLKDLIDPKHKPKSEKMPGILGTAATRYVSRIPLSKHMAPFDENPVSSIEEFWYKNQFKNYAKDLETPVFVWGSRNDWVVPNGVNGKALEDYIMKPGMGNVTAMNLEDGNHCGTSTPYGWATVSSVLKGYYLSHSDGYFSKNDFKEASIRIPTPKLSRREKHVSQEWVAITGKNYLELTYKTFHKSYPYYCGNSGRRLRRRKFKDKRPFEAARNCYSTYKVKVPFQQLPFRVSVPKSEAETHRLTRMINSKVDIMTSAGSPLIDTTKRPSYLRWYVN